MKKIVKFIDYFPGENSFIIPVFKDDNNENFVQIIDNQEVKHVSFQKSENDNTNFRLKKMTIKERKEIAYEYITVKEISTNDSFQLSAFKFNSDLILFGETQSLVEELVSFVGTMNGDLAMYDEIISILLRRKSNLERIAENLKKALNLYKEYNNNLTLNEFEHIGSLNTQPIKKLKIIKNRKDVVDLDVTEIIFRSINRITISDKSLNFDSEIKRINDFKKILLNELKNKNSYLDFLHHFE